MKLNMVMLTIAIILAIITAVSGFTSYMTLGSDPALKTTKTILMVSFLMSLLAFIILIVGLFLLRRNDPKVLYTMLGISTLLLFISAIMYLIAIVKMRESNSNGQKHSEIHKTAYWTAILAMIGSIIGWLLTASTFFTLGSAHLKTHVKVAPTLAPNLQAPYTAVDGAAVQLQQLQTAAGTASTAQVGTAQVGGNQVKGGRFVTTQIPN